MARIPGVPYDGPPRGYGNSGVTKMYIAIHNTSNARLASPQDEANYAQVRTDNISSHFYGNASSVIQSLDTSKDAWHAGSSWGNQRAIAFELVGTNSSTEAYWKKVIDRVAPVMAKVCQIHSIPVQSLSVAQAQSRNVRGFVTHNDMRLAWGGTTHTDPGPNFPEAYLIAKVKAAMNPVTPVPPVAVPVPIKESKMFLIKADDDNHVYLSNGVHVASGALRDTLMTEGDLKLVTVATTPELQSLLPTPQELELSAADRQAIVDALREGIQTTTTQAVQAAFESITGTTTFAVE